MIDVTDLSVAYDNRAILNRITLSFAPNQITALVGPNGCGKSTFLKTIAGLQKPISGQVQLNGQLITSLKRKTIAQHIAYMAQSPQAPEGLTVRQLVEHGAFARQSAFQKVDRAEVDALLTACGLEHYGDRHFAELSGGEKQRAWIAMCLLQNADYLLLDEPTSALDLGFQVSILRLLKSLQMQKHFGIILVLHDINQAAHFADHIIALKDGVVVANGAPSDVLSQAVVAHLYDADVTEAAHPITGNRLYLPLFEEAKTALATNDSPV